MRVAVFSKWKKGRKRCSHPCPPIGRAGAWLTCAGSSQKERGKERGENIYYATAVNTYLLPARGRERERQKRGRKPIDGIWLIFSTIENPPHTHLHQKQRKSRRHRGKKGCYEEDFGEEKAKLGNGECFFFTRCLLLSFAIPLVGFLALRIDLSFLSRVPKLGKVSFSASFSGMLIHPLSLNEKGVGSLFTNTA